MEYKRNKMKNICELICMFCDFDVKRMPRTQTAGRGGSIMGCSWDFGEKFKSSGYELQKIFGFKYDKKPFEKIASVYVYTSQQNLRVVLKDKTEYFLKPTKIAGASEIKKYGLKIKLTNKDKGI